MAQKNHREASNAADEIILLRNANKAMEVKIEKQRKNISHIEEERDHYLAEANEQVRLCSVVQSPLFIQRSTAHNSEIVKFLSVFLLGSKL